MVKLVAQFENNDECLIAFPFPLKISWKFHEQAIYVHYLVFQF